ncbi:response regulator [Paenibacillus sp. JDR-2]|uniref:response regulator n=1 Tax=Paenibacillus sp. (strain JDR-2) TaxID=324057 RepID=UPI0001666D02|nr:response regulator [Paenibacillus sp. JDR-2]ACT01200.1 two component transcriptional regulator, AraC family [Paenibacillus sp. JDR-2]
MIRVLIADDEPEFRDYLAHLTDWEALGFEICAQARNGKEVLELAELWQPQIALLDINMPIMDGLLAAEALKNADENTLIALLTGYGEFEYARKAIKLGVEDYVLKPFKKDELLASMFKFKAIINKRKDEIVQAMDDRFLAKERLLNTILTEEFDRQEDEFIRFFDKQGVKLQQGPFMVVSIEIDKMYQLWSKSHEIALWKFAVSNVLMEVVVSRKPMIVFNGPEGRIVILHVLDEEEDSSETRLEGYRKLCDYVKTYFKFTITVGVSRPAAELKDIRAAYAETVIALQNKLISGNGGLIPYSSLNDKGRGVGFNSMKWNGELLSALRRNDCQETEASLHEIKAYIRDHQLPVDFSYAIFMSIVSLCLSYITEMGGDMEQVLGSDFRPYQQIKRMSSLEDTFEWLNQIFNVAIAYYSKQKVSRPLQIVREVKEHIDLHYSDSELSVENIARYFHLDSSYIRKVFAKELNVSVAEYITYVRLNQAKQLLETTGIKLQEVSERVGYSDAGYFSKVFKKHCGVLPSEYMGRI